jgi:hypothetical protein
MGNGAGAGQAVVDQLGPMGIVNWGKRWDLNGWRIAEGFRDGSGAVGGVD